MGMREESNAPSLAESGHPVSARFHLHTGETAAGKDEIVAVADRWLDPAWRWLLYGVEHSFYLLLILTV